MGETRTSTAGDRAPASKGGLARSLGEFVGHIWRAVRHDPGASAERRVIRHDVQEEHRETMVLRRTTIEEIEVRTNDAPR